MESLQVHLANILRLEKKKKVKKTLTQKNLESESPWCGQYGIILARSFKIKLNRRSYSPLQSWCQVQADLGWRLAGRGSSPTPWPGRWVCTQQLGPWGKGLKKSNLCERATGTFAAHLLVISDIGETGWNAEVFTVKEYPPTKSCIHNVPPNQAAI